MISLVRPYMKALVACASLLASGALLVVLGYSDEGLPIISTAPFVAGLVALTSNQPTSRRHRGSGRRQADR